VPVIIFVLAAVVAHVVLRHTRFGLHVHAVGGNDAAATLNGVHTRRVVFLVYVIVGFFCGLASLLLSARLNSAEAVAGLGLELDVIAAVVLGGASIRGGSGTILGTMLGVCIIAVLRNGLFFAGVGGLYLALQTSSGNADVPQAAAYTLNSIAAVVIGGTSLFGGVGGVFGTVVGALLIGVLRNGLVLLNVSPFIQQIVIGLILVAAVAFDQYAAARRRA
jgi:ribose/xylose/arabinose/galactoside ABC-type transport system permease subunit